MYRRKNGAGQADQKNKLKATKNESSHQRSFSLTASNFRDDVSWLQYQRLEVGRRE